MNRPLSQTETANLTLVSVTMTRREKLLRFAAIIREASPVQKFNLLFPPATTASRFVIFHHLEYMTDEQLNKCWHPQSAFAAAAADPVLREAGLASDTVGEAKRFFELSKDDLHAFSCDCGGEITNIAMAARVEDIASR